MKRTRCTDERIALFEHPPGIKEPEALGAGSAALASFS